MVQKIVLAIIALCALGTGIYFSQQSKQPEVPLEARLFEPVRVINPFELTSQHNKTIDNAFFNDHWTMVFLGYTHCPDVCPTTLAQLTSAYKKLQTAGMDDAQVLFVSVDPQRDTPERLKEYTEYFHQDFTAASGPHANLYPLVRDLGLMYSMGEDTTQPEYGVDHSAAIALVNPQGQLHAMFKAKVELGGIPGVDMVSLVSEMQVIAKRF